MSKKVRVPFTQAIVGNTIDGKTILGMHPGQFTNTVFFEDETVDFANLKYIAVDFSSIRDAVQLSCSIKLALSLNADEISTGIVEADDEILLSNWTMIHDKLTQVFEMLGSVQNEEGS